MLKLKCIKESRHYGNDDMHKKKILYRYSKSLIVLKKKKKIREKMNEDEENRKKWRSNTS